MATQYKVFLLESENPNDIPTYINMLSPLNWSIFNFSKPLDFVQTILAGTKPDIIISNYNVPPVNLITSEGPVSVSNTLDLIEILVKGKFIEKIPTVLLLNDNHSVEEYSHCNRNSVPYLTKGKFEVEHLVDLLQREIRNRYSDGTDFLHILQYGNNANQIPSFQSNLDLVGMPLIQSHFTVENNNGSDSDKVVKKEAQVISFYNGGKGGVGKTTISTSFSVLLAMNGSRVLLIDADFYAPNCFFLLKVKPTRTIIDVKHILNHLTEDSFKDCLVKHSSGLDFLPGPVNQKDTEILYPEDLYQMISFAKQYYDFIIVDLPPKLPEESNLVDAIAHLSDKIVQVTTQAYSSISGITKAFQVLASSGIDPNKFYICVNGLNPKINYDPDSISTKVTAKQDYASLLKGGKVPVCGKIGSDEQIPIFESMMELYILNNKTKFRRDMEHMLMNLVPDYKLSAINQEQPVNKKEMKSNKSFMSTLSSLFSFKKNK
jgi:MinD-like ATPase involved in chromosome partitioning or flagellar assembly